jgi:hypothetical protein
MKSPIGRTTVRASVLCVLTAGLAIGVGGCAGGDDDASNGDDTVAPTEEEVRCPDNIPEFFAGDTSGMEVMGDNMEIKARLIAADPAPPQRFRNDWTVELMTPDGAPLEDAEIVKACAFMPVHGHGLGPRAITPGDGPGRFNLEGLNLSMRGPWEVQLAVESASVPAATARATNCDTAQGTDYLAFSICVADE